MKKPRTELEQTTATGEGREKRLTAAELIAAKKPVHAELTFAARVNLEELLAHNDKLLAYSSGRVGWPDAVRMLEEHGYPCSQKTLNKLCRDLFGRKGYSRA